MTEKIEDFVTLKAYISSRFTIAIANAYSLPRLKKAVRETAKEMTKLIEDYANNGYSVEV